jgi:tetratricopeptide (TPR) repeat protein
MKVSSRLDDLVDGVRHYRYNDIVEMCIDCSQDLIDQGYSENSIPFLDKSIDMLSGRTDLWSQNRIAESYNLLGEAKKNMGLQEEAAEAFTASILAATPIYRKCGLDDEMELVLSYVSRGDIEEKMGETASMVKDHEAAIDILEEMNAENKLDDTELLVNLHQGIAKVLMDEGNMKDAETHLLRVVDLGMPAMKEAISDLGIKRPDQ